MITLVTGKIGAGKTVYCIAEFIKLKNGTSTYTNVDNIYTNIDNFKHSYFDETPFYSHDLNVSTFYSHLKNLHEIYRKYEDVSESTDEALISYCKKNDFYNCFIVFDEAYNFFDNQDRVKIWYLNYCRHLHHHVFLLTPNISSIHTKYRKAPQIYIKAISDTNRIGSGFKFNKYEDSSMRSKIETETIENNPELFTLYTSGNFTKQKSYANKSLYLFIGSLILMFSLLAFVFYYITSSPGEENKSINETVSSNVKNVPVQNLVSVPVVSSVKEFDLTNSFHMELICSIKNSYCLYNNQKIDMKFYFKMKNIYNFNEISLSKVFNEFYLLNVFVNEKFYNIYNKGDNNEKNTSNNSNNEGFSLLK